jgi:serine O-acetyltransferase
MKKKSLIDRIRDNKPKLHYELKEMTRKLAEDLLQLLFCQGLHISETLDLLNAQFLSIVKIVEPENIPRWIAFWDEYIESIPEILIALREDAMALESSDPAAESLEEIYLCYPGFYATAVYRLSRAMYLEGLPLIPRMMSEHAHRLTGVDIHPGADIGSSFFIDHATGIVIGETTVIKNRVRLYQGVTLGALFVNKSVKGIKRHPTVEDNVTIYANATILGGDTVIGANSTIGGNVWLTESVPPGSVVYHTPEIKIKTIR